MTNDKQVEELAIELFSSVESNWGELRERPITFYEVVARHVLSLKAKWERDYVHKSKLLTGGEMADAIQDMSFKVNIFKREIDGNKIADAILAKQDEKIGWENDK